MIVSSVSSSAVLLELVTETEQNDDLLSPPLTETIEWNYWQTIDETWPVVPIAICSPA